MHGHIFHPRTNIKSLQRNKKPFKNIWRERGGSELDKEAPQDEGGLSRPCSPLPTAGGGAGRRWKKEEARRDLGRRHHVGIWGGGTTSGSAGSMAVRSRPPWLLSPNLYVRGGAGGYPLPRPDH